MIKEYTKKDGSKAYMFVAYLGVDPITGKQKRTTRRGFKTKREAKIAEARLQTEIEEKGFSNKPKKMTVQEAYEGWLSQYRLSVRESSLTVVTSLINQGILTEIGNQFVSTITRKQAQELVNKWFHKYKTYRKYKTYATQIMEYAVEEGAISTNPFSKVKMPRTQDEIVEKQANYYDKEELRIFLESIKDDPMYYAIFRTLAFTGIRKGELMSLKWTDLDINSDTLFINKTVTYGQDGVQLIGPPKTPTSNRSIRIDQGTKNALLYWKNEQKKLLLKYGHNSTKLHQYIFINPITNNLLSKMTITHKLWSICKEHNFKKITLHGFRHTCCSLLFEAGLSIKEVQQIMGHSSTKTTLDIYTHVTESQKENGAQKLSKLLDF